MSDEHPHGWAETLRAYRWPLVLVVIAILAFLAWQRACWTVAESGRAAADTVGELGETAKGIAEGFRRGEITETFRAELPHMLRGGTRLELAAFEATETFTRTEDKWMLYDLLHLGKTVTEIRVPITYRYYVSLEEPWTLEAEGQTVVVHAPPIRASVPPAIHTDRMEKQTETGWLELDADEQMDALERTITPRASALANNPDRIDLVRDRCRRQVERFVRGWLLTQGQWGEGRYSRVDVVFPSDETPEPPPPGPVTVPSAG